MLMVPLTEQVVFVVFTLHLGTTLTNVPVRSAQTGSLTGVTVVTAVTVLFPRLRSDSFADTNAMFVIEPTVVGAKFTSRIVFLPLISGISYELIRFAAKRQGSLLSLLTAPGLWLQRITTQEPSNEQTAVAIHALEGAMKLEEKQGGELVIA